MRGRYKRVFFIVAAVLFCAGFACGARAEEEDYLKSGIKLYNQGNYQEAIGHLGLARAKEFNNAVLHYYMANAFSQMGKKGDAVREFRIAYALDPESEVGKFSKQALQALGAEKEEEEAPPSPPVRQTPPEKSTADQLRDKTLSSLRNQASDASSIHRELGREQAASTARSANDIISRKRSAMMADMLNSGRRPGLTREAREYLSQLESMFNKSKQSNIESSNRRARSVEESSRNLQNLINESNGRGGHRLIPAGTNLYVRNYDTVDKDRKPPQKTPAKNKTAPPSR
ncbi:MAG: hypothetical protein KC777_18370 [Cyanobacteria bacterium HKST-UBA02]|nr:hypothetical protein [Cyanobacteria bacterium HKST-UBA02]